MTPDQCREARELLGWSPAILGRTVGLAPVWISNFEQCGELPTSRSDWALAIRNVLETAGVIFTNGSKPGVKLKRPKS